jgi:hypothetical protein
MSNTSHPDRMDTLLALALAYGPAADGGGDGQDGHASPSAAAALSALSATNRDDREVFEERARWYTSLPAEGRSRWLAQTLGCLQPRAPRLEEDVHPSHVVEVLRDEPPRVQELVLQNLPPLLAEACAATLYAARFISEESERQHPLTADDLMAALLPEARRVVKSAAPGEGAPPEVLDLIRRVFLSHFVSAEELDRATALDSLKGFELARLVRLLGVRETALACRGIESQEAVGSFLRRFSAEDARAIAAHIARLTDVGPRRVAFAGRLVEEAIGAEPKPEAMLDRLGMRLLAAALSTADPAPARNVRQKLPLLAARALDEMMEQSRRRDRPEDARTVAAEVERTAAGLRRNVRQQARKGDAHSQPPAAAASNEVNP